MFPSEKTIPYRPSPAELENLRILRKRTNPSCSIQDDEDDEMSGEIDAWDSDLEPANRDLKKESREGEVFTPPSGVVSGI